MNMLLPVSSVFSWAPPVLGHVQPGSPHAPQDLKEDQILPVQNWDDNEEDGNQKAEEEHHGLDDHAWGGKITAQTMTNSPKKRKKKPTPHSQITKQVFSAKLLKDIYNMRLHTKMAEYK